jgi:hypothetical protein
VVWCVLGLWQWGYGRQLKSRMSVALSAGHAAGWLLGTPSL